MSGNIDFSRPSSDATKTRIPKMYPISGAPRTPPRPDKRPSVPSLDAELKTLPGPEDFPRTLILDLPSDQRNSDMAKLLCEMKLPQCVKLMESFVVPGCSTALSEGDIVLLHFIYENPTVHATTSKGKNLRLPIYAEQKYEILPLDPRLDDMSYSGTKALMDADPLPVAVRVVEAHCSIRKDEDQEADEIIDIHGFEEDEERGRLLIGMSGSAPIKYSTDLITSRYTTMLSPDFHPMAEVIERKFPQRIRIPDETKSFGQRNFKEEKVLNLKNFSLDKCVVATRAGDNRIYSIPVTTPMKLAHNPMDMKDKHVLDILPALYPLVNTSWGVVDPTQEALKTSMEAIPQPIQRVMDVWFASEEGKRRACDVANQRVDNLKEEIQMTLLEMRRMKSDLDFFTNKNSALNYTQGQPPPLRPPRTPPYQSQKKKLPGLIEEPPKEPPNIPPRPPNSRKNSDVSSTNGNYDQLDDEYQLVDDITSPFPKDTPDMVMKAVREVLAKKEMELKEKTQQLNDWKKKYETVKKENESLKKTASSVVYEELPDFPEEGNYLQPNPSNLLPRTLPLRNYTVAQVGHFLWKHELQKYVDIFQANGVDGKLLVALNETHMSELQMTRLHALKLKLEVEKLELPPLPH